MAVNNRKTNYQEESWYLPHVVLKVRDYQKPTSGSEKDRRWLYWRDSAVVVGFKGVPKENRSVRRFFY